jgi:predicted PurR-regulated permease PerM
MKSVFLWISEQLVKLLSFLVIAFFQVVMAMIFSFFFCLGKKNLSRRLWEWGCDALGW